MHIRTQRLALVVLVAAIAAACAGVDGASNRSRADAADTPDGVRAACAVKVDDYRGTATVRCPDREGELELVAGDSIYKAHLRGMANRGGAESFQLYVATRLDRGWENFRAARDQHEIPLEVTRIDRKKTCKSEDDCAYYEHFGIAFSRPYLEARTVRGIELRVRSHAGESVIELPAAYVAGFMQRFDEARGGAPASARAAASANRKSFCKGKYGSDDEAYRFCEQQARASYDRLAPALGRMRQDAYTAEARALDQCMKRHGSRMGLDWMMVEHCYAQATGRPPASHGR